MIGRLAVVDTVYYKGCVLQFLNMVVQIVAVPNVVLNFFFYGTEFFTLAVGMIVAFLVSVLVIKFLMNYIKKNDFKVFGYYRIILGALIILVALFKMLLG